MYINKEQLVSYIKKLNEPKVLVIGDLAIDEMIYGDAERISREAPVLILRHSNTKLILGAASNAAHNVSTLNNGKVSVIGVCGDDFQATQLRETFEEANVNCGLLVVDPSRKTTTKTKSTEDKSTYPLFGDAGSATALEFDENNDGIKIHAGTDGSKFEAINIPDGGFRNQTTLDSLKTVEIEPGVDALLHVSQIAKHHVDKPADELSIGQEIEAKIVDFNEEEKKISLSMKELLPDEEVEDTVEEPVEEATEDTEE